MHRTGSRKRWISLAGILFLLFLAGNAAAAEKRVTAACPSRCTECVYGRYGKDGIIVSIPGYWDLTAMTLEAEGCDVLYLGEGKQPVRPGEAADLSGYEGQPVTVLDGKERVLGRMTILQGSAIPTLFLEVDAGELGKVNRSKDNVITEGRAVYREADGSVSYDGALTQMKGRGNNTFSYRKKPYQIKLEKKASLSGMGKGKTWVLLANWTDVSLLRNQIVLDMCREIGLKNAVSCVQADVWINGNYQGLYLIAEKVQIGSGRIPITDLEEVTEKANEGSAYPGRLVLEKRKDVALFRSYPDVKNSGDITGGYIVTVEKAHRLKNYLLAGFRTKTGLNIRIKEPTYPSRAQALYLAERFSALHRAVLAKDGTDPQTGKHYGEYLDTESCARKYLVEEWSKNYDFLGGSQYYYKDSDLVDPLIYAGPAWDYDLSFGNMNDRGYSPTGKYLSAYTRNTNLYWLLYSHEEFRDKLKELWGTAFRPAGEILLGQREPGSGSVLTSLDEYRARIEKSARMNYSRWLVSTDATGRDSGGSFDHAVKYLKDWITQRLAWMDEEFGNGAE